MLNKIEINRRIQESVVDYCHKLHAIYSKLLVVRVDLGYVKKFANQCGLLDIKRDIKHMLDNRRGSRTLFEHLVGYVVKYEFTKEKGPHAHALFFYDGQKVCKDEHYGQKIGKYWIEKIAKGNGVFYSCNYDKDQYEQCGIGMIDHSDFVKRAVLEEKVIGYMLKAEQSINDIKQTGRERSITRGVPPRNRSCAGRPRS